jgi:hypothetical protein
MTCNEEEEENVIKTRKVVRVSCQETTVVCVMQARDVCHMYCSLVSHGVSVVRGRQHEFESAYDSVHDLYANRKGIFFYRLRIHFGLNVFKK